MNLKKLGFCAATIAALAVAAAVIFSFDASDTNIARPPSVENLASRQATGFDGDLDDARKKFTHNPLDRYAVYSLFQRSGADLSEGDRSRLLDLAASRALRDGEIQSPMIDRLIKGENYSGAVYRLDGLMRARTSFRPALHEVLAQFAQGRDSRLALIGVLTKNPPWRTGFLAYLAQSKLDLFIVSSVFIGLRTTESPPRQLELRPFFSKLVLDGEAERAYSLWLSFLTEDQLARVGYVYDGQFEAMRTEAPFDWTIMPEKNVVARVSPSADEGRGKVLEVMFANAQVQYRNVYQHLLLPPGRYILSGDYKTNKLESERGLAWKLYCSTNASQAMAESSSINGTHDWVSFEADFSVPEIECNSQVLRLELIAKATLDRKVSGALWFDDIAIRRADQ